MSNSIHTNYGAIIALQSLNRTNVDLDQAQKRVSTGYRVADNIDDGASFAIAEGLRGNVKALEAVNEQLGKAKGLLNVASSAATSISTTLQDIEAVLIKLSDEAVSGTQRAQYIADYDALKTEISNYIGSASFNGTNLLDGTSGNINVISDIEGGSLAITEQNLLTGVYNRLTDITEADATTEAGALIASGGGFQTAKTALGTSLAALGADYRALDNQETFIATLQDATEVGIGAIVDADLAKESAKLQSLQIRQQLATQTLGIANQAPSILLGLFS